MNADQATRPATPNNSTGDTTLADRIGAARRAPWVVFILPLAVYMLIGSLEPATAEPVDLANTDVVEPPPLVSYPVVYSIKTAAMLAALAFCWPGIRQFPWKLSPLSIGVGIMGIVIWVGLAWVQDRLGWTGGLGRRAGYNPLAEMGQGWLGYGFLAVRFVGLVIAVPLAEELFLRGFLMRFVIAADWWTIPFGTATRLAVFVGTAFPVVSHLNEALAAAVWFSLVTWLMIRTRNFWDCVAAHAVTNLLLGAYVVAYDQWGLM